MTLRTDTETDWADETYKSKDDCLDVMRNRSFLMERPHCAPDWDPYTALCWGPTPPGVITMLRCPDDGFLNPKQFASRTCLPNATWYINTTFDDKPFTNFDNCFLPTDPSAEDDLKQLAGEGIFQILKYVDAYTKTFLTLHIVSIALLAATIIVCTALVLKLGQKRYTSFTYSVMVLGAIALLTNHVVTISVSAVGDALHITKCGIIKSLISWSAILFYECLCVYLYLCIRRILNQAINARYLKMIMAASVVLATVIVLAGGLTELHLSSNTYCGFRNLQSSYHWITTVPKHLLIMSVISLDSVTIFGAFFLEQPHLVKSGELRHIRQMGISVLIVLVCSLLGEILLILIHTVEYLMYSGSPLEVYVQAFSLVASFQGAMYSVLMCSLDLGVLAMLGFPFKNPNVQKKLPAESLEEVSSPPFVEVAKDSSMNLSREDRDEHELSRDENSKGELLYQRATPTTAFLGPSNRVYESKLIFGPLKET